MRQKYENELKQAGKETINCKQKSGKSLLLGNIDGMVQDYLRVSESLSS